MKSSSSVSNSVCLGAGSGLGDFFGVTFLAGNFMATRRVKERRDFFGGSDSESESIFWERNKMVMQRQKVQAHKKKKKVKNKLKTSLLCETVKVILLPLTMVLISLLKSLSSKLLQPSSSDTDFASKIFSWRAELLVCLKGLFCEGNVYIKVRSTKALVLLKLFLFNLKTINIIHVQTLSFFGNLASNHQSELRISIKTEIFISKGSKRSFVQSGL